MTAFRFPGPQCTVYSDFGRADLDFLCSVLLAVPGVIPSAAQAKRGKKGPFIDLEFEPLTVPPTRKAQENQHPKHPGGPMHPRPDYKMLFETCVVDPAKVAGIDQDAAKIARNRERYTELVKSVSGNIPWWFVGLVHLLEASLSFKQHLHNGDPLTARTVREPKGRPVHGNPPLTWEQSAQDSLAYQGLTKEVDWSLGDALYLLEGYNGYGYLFRGINSPYLWSFSNRYSKGKYLKDHVFDPNVVSQQVGVAVVLKRLASTGAVVLGN